MPELPDLSVVGEALHAVLSGRAIEHVEAVAPLAVRGTPTELSHLDGQRLLRVRRRGKFLLFDLDTDRVVINPMLTGRFQLSTPGARRPSGTAVVMAFGPRAHQPTDTAAWTRGATWQPDDTAAVEVRYTDRTQMGKVYVLPAGVARTIPGGGPDDQGPDADDPALTLDVWRARIRPYRGELKNLLRNQDFVAGIGNAYADEILHAARLLPSRKRSSLAPDEVDELYQAMRTTLAGAVTVLRNRVPPTFEKQVRDVLIVHGKGGEPCPRCGTRISQITPGGFITSFCRGCQR